MAAGGGIHSTEYSADIAYPKHHIVYVQSRNSYSVSLTDDNLGNDPATDFTNWYPLWAIPDARSYFVTTGQNVRLPDTLGTGDVVNAEGVLSFETTAIQEVGGGVKGIRFENIQDIANADARLNSEGEVVNAANAVITIPADLYDISFKFYGNQRPDNNVYVGLFEVNADTDDVDLFSGNARQKDFFGTTDSDIHAVYQAKYEDLPLLSDTKYYFRLMNEDDRSQNRIGGYLRINQAQ